MRAEDAIIPREDQPPPRVRPVRRAEAPPALAAATMLVETAAALESPACESVIVAPAPLVGPAPSLGDAPARKRFLDSSPACPREREVARTLSDPVRGEPLAHLAERLRSDIERSASKTVLLTGVGASPAHDTLLYAAALLAQPLGNLLVIDANLPRRHLTEGLERGSEAGLGELLQGGGPPLANCRPTGLSGVSLLPAGQVRHLDLSAAGPRLEEVLQELAAEYAVVLIEGGQAGDLASGALARLADATYFVVQLGAVDAAEAQAALRDFRAAGARVLGCIAT